MRMPADDDLLRRSVCNARKISARKGEKHARWVAVMDNFSLGSTASQLLCLRFGLDPDELVKR